MEKAPLEAVSQSLGHSGVDVTKRFYAKQVSTYPVAFLAAIEIYLDANREAVL